MSRDRYSLRVAALAAGQFAGKAMVACSAAVLVLMLVASPVRAAFPGANGLLAVQPAGGTGVILVSPDGQNARPICNDPVCAAAIRPAWSPDGQELVYTDPGGGGHVVYVDGTCLNCVLGYALSAATFTPAGDILAVDSSGVKRVGVDGLLLGRVIAAPAKGAVWSVNGRVAFVRSVHGRAEVFVTDPSRRSVSQLTRTGASSPSWSPGGTRLAVVHAGVVELIDLRGRVIRRLARGVSPAFSPDGRQIAYIVKGGQLRVIPVAGGQSRPVGTVHGQSVDWQPLPAQPPAPCVAPSGSAVVASSPDAVVTSRADKFGDTAYLACLRSAGRERYLGVAFSTSDPYEPMLSQLDGFVLAGDYVAFFYYTETDYKGTVLERTGEVRLTNLLSDRTLTFDLDLPQDNFFDPSRIASIATIVLTPSGLLAWETTVPSSTGEGSDETISAYDSQGTHTLDTETVTTSPGLANLAISGDTVTWTHDGQPRSATLQP